MRRKKERSKQGQTNKFKQHSTHKAVTFPRKNELPQVGLEPTTLYSLDRALYQLSYQGSTAGWAHMYMYMNSGVCRFEFHSRYRVQCCSVYFILCSATNVCICFALFLSHMYVGCVMLLCLVVCLTLLASFFLPSHLSLKHV